jgi:hypothetical protein
VTITNDTKSTAPVSSTTAPKFKLEVEFLTSILKEKLRTYLNLLKIKFKEIRNLNLRNKFQRKVCPSDLTTVGTSFHCLGQLSSDSTALHHCGLACFIP